MGLELALALVPPCPCVLDTVFNVEYNWRGGTRGGDIAD